ncbi:ATP-grasp fold amidoligase family protein [Caballeronia grimmiae]|uniref:ATP-grasp fold amidoligase family protein n=1 Tax=Caballeronia grimmiae TaxID=1071679 RepID=UPI0038B92F4E
MAIAGHRFSSVKKSPSPIPRSDNLYDLRSTAAELARDFDYVRVDLYTLKDQIYFGELTSRPVQGCYQWAR